MMEVEIIDNYDFDPNMGDYGIEHAARDGKYDMVKFLLSDLRVDPTIKGNYAVRWAAVNGHYDVVKLLMSDPRVDPSDKNNHAIRAVLCRCNVEMTLLLLNDSRVDPCVSENSLLTSIYNCEKADVEKLLKDSRIANFPGIDVHVERAFLRFN